MRAVLRYAAARYAASPFFVLVGHFLKRLFAPEDEQSATSGLGLGPGAVLAMLASPGAFASIFLMTKYSSLMQFLHGRFFDAIHRSPSDEYFFIVLSMTVTGLVMVARWSRLFPDRRDFSNLAVLPIPIRHIFLANLLALLAFGVLFGLDVNVVSALLFPLFVSINYNSFPILFQIGFSHAVTVFSASLFSFFAVFALVGFLLLLVPARLIRPVSLTARILLVVGLLTEFYSNIFIGLFAGKLPGGVTELMRWLPSYWFLGIYERLAGIASPQMALLGARAFWSLCAAIFLSLLLYALCYRRLFLRLPESFDTVAGSRPFFQIRWPEPWLRLLFRTPFERAVAAFTLKALLRSEQHLLFFGAYLGVGLVIVSQTLLDPGVPVAAPLLVAFFVLTGLRLTFDMPSVLTANWLFQAAAHDPLPAPKSIAKRLLLAATVPWEIALVLPLAMHRAGWWTGALYTAFVLAMTILLAEALLMRFDRIPFTCRTELEIRQLLVRLLCAIFAVSIFVPALGGLVVWALASPLRTALLALALVAVWIGIDRRRRSYAASPALRFENAPAPAFELLKLS